MLYREIIAVCSEIHIKHINTVCGQNVELLNVKSGGTYSYHWALKGLISVIQTSQLMLHREIIAVCSEINTKYTNSLCGQVLEFVDVKPGGTYSDHWAVKISSCHIPPDSGLPCSL
jgi:hypothetical protein